MSELKLKLKLNTDTPLAENQQEEAEDASSTIPTPSTKNPPVKIGIKGVIPPQKTQEEIQEIAREETLEGVEEQIQQVPEPVSSGKIGLSSIKSVKKKEETGKEAPKTKATQYQKEIDDSLPIETPRDKNAEKIFWNYKSGFQEKSQNLMDTIRNFTRKPKTRVWLLLFLIVASASTIGWLMLLAPEKHSFSIYKASIFEIYNTQILRKTPTKVTETTEVESPVEANQSETVIVESEVPIVPVAESPEEERKRKVKEYLLRNYSE